MVTFFIETISQTLKRQKLVEQPELAVYDPKERKEQNGE